MLADKNVLAYEIRRLGPDPGRDIQDSVVADLMIHDLDVVRSLVDEDPVQFTAAGRTDEKHATATLTFSDDIVATLTASRVTQRKIRELGIATDDGYIHVDYLDRRVEIYRGSMRQMIQTDDTPRYHHESVIERPLVENTEPLRNELKSFLAAVNGDQKPVVTAEDGLAAIRLAKMIEAEAFPDEV